MDYGTSGVNRRVRNAAPKNEAPQQDPLGGFVDRLDPKKLEFGDGGVVTMILTGIDRVQVGNPPKMAARYSFEDFETGEKFFMIGTHQLDSKIVLKDLGHVLRIRYEGTDPSVTRNGNAMKKFHVQVSVRCAPGWAQDGTPITDDDLPPEAYDA